VTPRGFDDIGAVLKQLGKNYEYHKIKLMDMYVTNSLNDCDVLFINCNSSSRYRKISQTVRDFVARGGALYASDWAGEVIQHAFPGFIRFCEFMGEEGVLRCRALDPGLKELVGESFDIHLDVAGWWQVIGRSNSVKVHVASHDNMSIVCEFRYEKGYVIFTSFHYEAMLSPVEQKLLRYLVLRPVLSNVAEGAAQIAVEKKFTPGKEILETISQSQKSSIYKYSQSNKSFIFILHWRGRGLLRLCVQDPSGKVVYNELRSQPPLTYEVHQATAGDWRCWVEAERTEHDNLPFILTLATRK
jgi:hypothetical protein